jgi:hypothetical protein
MNYYTEFLQTRNYDQFNLDLDKYLPNIPNAQMTYDAYRAIFLKYPDLLTNKTLGHIYNAIKPTSLYFFELVVKGVIGRGIDVEQVHNIALLMSLLYR